MNKTFSRNCYFIFLVLLGYWCLGRIMIQVFSISLPDRLFSCGFYEKTGYYCPGCGGTRAFRLCMQGHFLKSLKYHPFVLVFGLYLLPFLASHTAAIFSKKEDWGMKIHRWHVVLLSSIFILPCIIKNIVYLIWNIHLM